MTAPREAVEAVEAALECERKRLDGHLVCLTHLGPDGMLIDWTDRGCPVAVAAADAAQPAIAAQALREVADECEGDDGPDSPVTAWLRASAATYEAPVDSRGSEGL